MVLTPTVRVKINGTKTYEKRYVDQLIYGWRDRQKTVLVAPELLLGEVLTFDSNDEPVITKPSNAYANRKG